jgi:phosphatidylglycerophosphate synthase
MKFSQIFTAPNQLTLLRMAFVPFVVIELVEGRYFWALVLFVIAGFSDGLDGLLACTSKPYSANISIPLPTSFC